MTPPPTTTVWPEEATGVGALSGLRVLDLSRILAGPYCGQMLSDHGASVVKVESPRGDDTRKWGVETRDGSSDYYYALNRNKRNVVLDFASQEDRDLLLRLVDEADVLIENFKAGTMERWGLGFHDHLAARNPRLVFCHISGFGDDGELGGLPGYDAVLQAFGGLMSVNGYADRRPLRVGVPIVDIVAANLCFSGVLLALNERTSSGMGQYLDVSLLDSVTSLLIPHSGAWAMSGSDPKRTGDAHPSVAPYQTFETPHGDFFISAGNDRQFGDLMTILGRPGLATDPRFERNAGRSAHREELAAIIQDCLEGRDLDVLAMELGSSGVPASVVNTISEALSSAQVAHRNLFIDDGHYRGVGVPIKLGRSGHRHPSPPAPLGADTETVRARVARQKIEDDS